MIKPFQIVWELIEFGLQALFLYVLAVILCIGLITYVIVNNKQKESEVQYIYEKAVIEKEVQDTAQEVIKEKECKRISGCRVLEDGTIEY